MKRFLVAVIIFISFFVMDVNAYTKEDIIESIASIEACSSSYASLVKGLASSYTRILNERNIVQSDIDIIYNNMSYLKKQLSDYGVCSLDDKDRIPSDVLSNLYNLYKQTNDIINNSRTIVDNKKSEINVVIDNSSNEIKIYESGKLSTVVASSSKLNYVGINKWVNISLYFMMALLVVLFLINHFKRGNLFIVSFIYVLILAISLIFAFRSEVSLAMDAFSMMRVRMSEGSKEAVALDKKIISYPSYGNDYADIYINGKEGSIYYGDSASILKKGIGQSSDSYLPGEGKKVILSGHNTGVFGELLNLNKGSKVRIETVYGRFYYEVLETKVINDTDVKALDLDYDLIMYTCYPNSSLYGNKRFIVYANVVDEDWIGVSNEK